MKEQDVTFTKTFDVGLVMARKVATSYSSFFNRPSSFEAMKRGDPLHSLDGPYATASSCKFCRAWVC